MKYRSFVTWLFLMPFLPAMAQNAIRRDAVISDKAVRERYKPAADSSEWMGYDVFNQKYAIRSSRKLRTAGKMTLPASVWAMFYREEDAGNKTLYKYKNSPGSIPENAECILCWMGLREAGSESESAVRKKLSGKYGTLTATDSKGNVLTGVPARWLNDTLTTALNPYCYAGLWVQSSTGVNLAVSNGYATKCKLAYAKKDYNNDLYITVMDMAPQFYTAVDGNGSSARQAKWLEMTLLAYDINKLCTIKKQGGKKLILPIYLRADAETAYHIELLGNRRLDDGEAAVLGDLKNAFAKMPACSALWHC